MHINVNEKLSHLSEEQLNELIKRYYANENVKLLIKEYSINTQVSQLYSLFPPILLEDKQCPYCHIPLVKERGSRSNPLSSSPYCPNCKHIEDNNCQCTTCTQKREEASECENLKKRTLIEKYYALNLFEPVKFEVLSFANRVYLGALLRLCLAEDFSIIHSINHATRDLTPLYKFTRDIILRLCHENIIAIHPNSPLEAFAETDEHPYPHNFYIYNVNYYLNLTSSIDRNQMINDLLNPSELDPQNREEAYRIWRNIALTECLEYLSYQMTCVGFEFNPGEKTHIVFKDLLNHFSVSQIYGIIYSSVTHSTRLYQERKMPKKQAANSVIGACQRHGERALAQQWDLKKYHRDFNVPQTMISEFFFNRVLKIGDLGFDLPPTIP